MAGKKVRNTLALVVGIGASAAVGLPDRGMAAPGGTAAPTTEARDPVRLEVDVSERKLYVYHGGDLMNTFDVAVGQPEHPTPRGSFTIDRIEWNPDWVPPNEGWAEDKEKKAPNDPDNPMRGAKLFFEYPDYYIHGTDEPHTLGTAASHGCVRMKPGDVMNLAEFVQEHGGEPRSDGWYGWVKRNDASEHQVTLPDPIPVEVRD